MSTWYIKAVIPSSQKSAVESTLEAHGIPLSSIKEVPLPEKAPLPPFLEVVFPVDETNALATTKAIAHAAQTENPKSSKIFLLPSAHLVSLEHPII